MAKDINKTRLKALKKKSYARKKATYDLDSYLSNITKKLFPRTQDKKETSKKEEDVDYSGKIAELEKKLAQSEKDTSTKSSKKEQELQKSLNKLRNSLTGQMQSLGQSTMQNDNALQEAINKSSKSKSQAEDTKEQKSSEGTTQPDTQRDAYGPHNNFGRALEEAAEEATAVTEEPKAKRVVKNITAKIGEYVNVGSYKYKVTNLFGIRTGENAVSGREGKHSRGIDVVGTDAQGRNTNIPISLVDGKIINIGVDGSGDVYKPDAKDGNGNQLPGSLGVYMDVKFADNKVMRFGHLAKEVLEDKAALTGTAVKRGQPIHNRDNSIGTGSQTAPHTKIQITTIDKDGKYLLDFSKEENDPTPYLFGRP